MDALEKIISSLDFLLGNCDGANSIDNIGFNKVDGVFAQSLKNFIDNGKVLTDKKLKALLMMMTKYSKTQLKPSGYSLPDMGELSEYLKYRSLKMSAKVEKRILSLSEAGGICVEFGFNKSIYEILQTIVPFSKFDKETKIWLFDFSQNEEILEKLIPLGFTVSDNLKQKLESEKFDREMHEQNILDRKYWCLDWIENNLPDNFSMFDHQWTGIDFLLSDVDSKSILGHDTGLGKSLQAIATAKSLQEYYRLELETDVRVILICPVSLKINWIRECQKFDLKIELYSWASIPSPPASVQYIVIADELHLAQNYTSYRTKNLLALAKDDNCVGFLGLTGTPTRHGRPSNLFPLLSAVNHPVALNKTHFDIRYCDAKSTPFTKWDVTGSINLEELNKKIESKIQIIKKEDCLDLPPKMFVDLQVESSEANNSQYLSDIQNAKAEYLQKVREGQKSATAIALVMMNHLRRLSSNFKCEFTTAKTQELLDCGKQVVIFTEFKDSAFILGDRFNVTPLTGELDIEERQKLIDDFQSEKQKVFVSTHKAGGVGITLTASQYLFIHDFPWSPGDYQQSCDRIHRIGQNGTCTIYNLYGKDIDYIMADILNFKSENISKVLKKVIPGKKNLNDKDSYYKAIIDKLLA